MKTLIAAVVIWAWAFSVSYAVEAGELARDFEAVSTQGQVRLGDYLGKKNVVLAFYYADFTPV